MDKLVLALAPAFAAGFALQQLLEILDPIVKLFTRESADNKKLILSIVSLVVGVSGSLGRGVACATTSWRPRGRCLRYLRDGISDQCRHRRGQLDYEVLRLRQD